jgi:hypothetical protein
VNRPLVVISLIGLAMVAACSNGTTGSPSPTGSASATTQTDSPSTPATSASAAADPLARTNPCTLLDPAIASQNQLTHGAPETGPAIRFCRWSTPISTDPQYEISIGIYDQYGLDALNPKAFNITDYPVGGHQGRLSKQVGGSVCIVSIAVTKTSRVDVSANVSNGQIELGCSIAEPTAKAVEQKLPVGSG